MLVGLTFLLLTSCSNQEFLTRSTESSETSILTSGTTVLHKPIVADLQVETKRKSSIYEANLRLPLSDLRENALALFLREHGCDFAVDPVYNETVLRKGRIIRSIQIEVEAFPANYTSFQQVDSLPKSILEYHRMDVPVSRSSYLTELQEPESVVGLEFNTGNYFGFQIDSKLPNRNLRFFFATESYSENMMDAMDPIEFEFEEPQYDSQRQVQERAGISGGLMKEFSLGRRLTARGLAGAQFGGYQVNNVYVSNRSFESFVTGGLRFGTGLDLSFEQALL